MLGLDQDGLASAFLPQISVTHIKVLTPEEIVSFGILPSIRALIVQRRLITPGILEMLVGNLPNMEFLGICQREIVSVRANLYGN